MLGSLIRLSQLEQELEDRSSDRILRVYTVVILTPCLIVAMGIGTLVFNMKKIKGKIQQRERYVRYIPAPDYEIKVLSEKEKPYKGCENTDNDRFNCR